MSKVTIELEFGKDDAINEALVFSYLKALHEDGGIDFDILDPQEREKS